MRRTILRITGLTLSLWLGLGAVASACPSCKEAMAADGGKYVDALFWSILFMLAMPCSIVSAFGFSVYRATRNMPKPVLPGAAAADSSAFAADHLENESSELVSLTS